MVVNIVICNLVRVTVGAGSSVLQIPLPLLCTLPGYPDTAPPVGDTSREVVNRRGLVGAGQPSLIVLNRKNNISEWRGEGRRRSAHLALVRIVSLDMSDVMPGEFVNGSLQRRNFTIKLSRCQQQMLPRSQ